MHIMQPLFSPGDITYAGRVTDAWDQCGLGAIHKGFFSPETTPTPPQVLFISPYMYVCACVCVFKLAPQEKENQFGVSVRFTKANTHTHTATSQCIRAYHTSFMD